MALAYRVTAVDNGGVTPGVVGDLTLAGSLRVSVEFIETGPPIVVHHTMTFTVPQTMTTAQIGAVIQTEGKKIRDARVRITQLLPFIGTVTNLEP